MLNGKTINHINFFQKGSIEIVKGKGTHDFPYHTHESLLIGVVISGETRFNIDHKEYLLSKGMTYLVPPDTGMSITHVLPYHYLTICIKKDSAIKLPSCKAAIYMLEDVGERICDLCERYQMDMLSEEEFIITLEIIFELQVDCNDFNLRYVRPETQIAVKYIKEHIYSKFVLNQLAEAVHISKYHLIRIFKMDFGITPKQYDQLCRLRQVKKSILKKEAEVDISMDLYYSSQSHLCSIFKRYMGISINDYKNNVVSKEQ